MRIGVDCRPLVRDQVSGIPAYVRGILTSLGEMDLPHEFILYAPEDFNFPLPNSRWKKRFGSQIHNGTLWMQLELPSWIKSDHLDLYWGTQNILPLLLDRRVKTVLTVHDVMYRIYPELMVLYNYFVQKFLFPPSLKRANAVVAISQSTMSDMERLFPIHPGMKKYVIHNGVSKEFYPTKGGLTPDQFQSKFGFAPKYILVVGTFEPRKNLGRVIHAFTQIASRVPHDLVIVGPKGWENPNFQKEVEESHIQDRVHFIGYVKDEDLPVLYSWADVFVFASLYEGFGLPPLEAMACGTPVICSNVSSMPEVVGDAAALVNPTSTNQMEEALSSVLTNEGLKQKMSQNSIGQSKKFSWDSTSEKLLKVFEELGNGD